MYYTLDSGQRVAFGQSLEQFERAYSITSFDLTRPPYRKGVDKMIRLKDVCLIFDAGKLRSIEFGRSYRFDTPPTLYREIWKNLEPIRENQIRGRMSRHDVLVYLAAWEERARAFGKEAMAFGNMTEHQYAISAERTFYMDMIQISIGPTRKTGGGGLWCDGWSFCFSIASDEQRTGEREGTLESLTAFRDEFNTVARR